MRHPNDEVTTMKPRLLALLLLTALAAPAAAQFSPQATASPGSAPQGINYQGRLEDGGFPATGSKSMVFRVFDVATGGTALWTSPAQSVEVQIGLFNAVVPVPLTALVGGGSRYLEVQIDGTVMAPRELLNSVPYALIAKSVEGTIDVSTAGLAVLANSAATTPALYISSQTGNVGIGTSIPGAAFDVDGAVQFGSGATKSTFTAAGDLRVARNITVSSAMVTGNYFSVGGSTLVVRNGRVGVGTNNPQQALDVTGNVAVNGGLAMTNAVVSMDFAGNNGVAFTNGMDGWSGNFGSAGNGSISLSHGDYQTLTLTGTQAGTIALTGGTGDDGGAAPGGNVAITGGVGSADFGGGGTDGGPVAITGGAGGNAGASPGRAGGDVTISGGAGGPGAPAGSAGRVLINPSLTALTGVGTASPATTLDVNGAAQFGSGATKSTFTAAGNLLVPARVGVGTANPALGTLQVSGAGTANIVLEHTGGADLELHSNDGNGLPGIRTSPTTTALSVQDSGNTVFGRVSGNVGVGTANPATKLHMSSGTITVDGNAADSLTTTGNVGVGTASPGSRLHVFGGTSSLGGAIAMQGSGISGLFLFVGDNSGTDTGNNHCSTAASGGFCLASFTSGGAASTCATSLANGRHLCVAPR